MYTQRTHYSYAWVYAKGFQWNIIHTCIFIKSLECLLSDEKWLFQHTLKEPKNDQFWSLSVHSKTKNDPLSNEYTPKDTITFCIFTGLYYQNQVEFDCCSNHLLFETLNQNRNFPGHSHWRRVHIKLSMLYINIFSITYTVMLVDIWQEGRRLESRYQPSTPS